MWEFLRTLIPALIALIPSYFLYRQNKESGIREAQAAKQRLDHDERLKQLEADANRRAREEDARASADRTIRESVAPYLAVVQKLRIDVLLARAEAEYLVISQDMSEEITRAYEAAMIRAPAGLRPALEATFEQVEAIYSGGRQDTRVEAVTRLEQLLREVREST